MKNLFRKKDLKSINRIDITNIIFENDDIRDLYNLYIDKSALDIRLAICVSEEYFYLDLSEMELTDDMIIEIFKKEEIENILNKIEMLDLSDNNLTMCVDLNRYTNIKFLNISNNKIINNINIENIIELNCENNKITGIISNSVIRLIAYNNIISNIYLPNIESLIIYNNKLSKLCDFNNIKTLDCRYNNILNIDYLKTLQSLCCSTNKISKDYNIKNIEKIENNYYIDFN